GRPVVVVAADRVGRVPPHPVDRPARVRPVLDQVAEAQADVEGLPDGVQGGPITVDVGDNEDAHHASGRNPRPAGRPTPSLKSKFSARGTWTGWRRANG